ncbi:unknown; predicted coding region [Mycoplasmopsis pulmonis]|uniref:Uncharacterized protein n=1 Tax=Mycoplasmopsis pulmonis (strain UAB CTIP) TaxID=272635 RepID=Q98QY0_MYCPU|nr:hypothetical protein [Mycoplasmopsis pulmonis]MDZ7293193.1 hypothetical protein [Mycoplasmopsis pulmonis]CAC13403.1 unknown; predicted coding region [Mycoplasmopsis pulmonis]
MNNKTNDQITTEQITTNEVLEKQATTEEQLRTSETQIIDTLYEEFDNIEDLNLEPKSHSSWEKLENSTNYEDLVMQTKEIATSVSLNETEMKKIEEDSLERRKKIELLEARYDDLNAKPLSGVDSYDNFNLVLNKSSWNYNEILKRNTQFKLIDLVLQVQLYLYSEDTPLLSVEKIQGVLKDFIDKVAEKIIDGHAVVLNSIIILDTVRFDQSSILPIAVANPKLMPPINVIEWDTFITGEENLVIIDTFIQMIENSLSRGHEVEFFENSLFVRNIEGITSLFINEEASRYFNSRITKKYSSAKKQSSSLIK